MRPDLFGRKRAAAHETIGLGPVDAQESGSLSQGVEAKEGKDD